MTAPDAAAGSAREAFSNNPGEPGRWFRRDEPPGRAPILPAMVKPASEGQRPFRVAATRLSEVEERRGGNDMARVTGVGGVFLKSADPKALGAWYAKHLGVEIGDYGATFWWKDEVPKGTGMTTCNPSPMATTYFGEGNQTPITTSPVHTLY